MKQFDLKEYLANPSRKLVTGDGRKVKILCTNRKGPYPVVVLVENHDSNTEDVYSYRENGLYSLFSLSEQNNLFFAPEKHEGYVNLLKDLNGNAFIGDPSIYKSKEDAERWMEDCSNYIAAAKIEWEE